MRGFLYKLLLFLSAYLILAYPLDLLLSNYLKESNEYPAEFEVWNDIYSGNLDCEIAIYGSSRAWVHINSSILQDSLNKKVYNFGIDGHNFWLTYLRHLEYLKHNTKPKQIIVSADYFALQKREDLYQLEQFLPYMLWNKNIREYTSSYIGFSTLDYFLPLLRYRGKTEAIKTAVEMFKSDSPQKKYRNLGFAGFDRVWNDDFDKAKAEMSKYEADLDKESIELLERFIKECIEKKIDLIFVYTPEYELGRDFIANRDEILNHYHNLSEKYNIKFIDYSNSDFCSNRSLFYNFSHLNIQGANSFSSKLASDLKKYNLTR
jgi:hypothetical protein